MHEFAYIATWVFGSVCVGTIAGFFLGRSMVQSREDADEYQERQTTLKVLTELLSAVERLNTDVDCHNSEIQQTAHDVEDLEVTGEMEGAKRALLGYVSALLTSNKQLQVDVTYARYHMEEQAQQIDDARLEARMDSLTAVANRKALEEKFHLLLADWQRHHWPFVLILLDLDHFKRINDAHGHQAGDHALQRAGTWLKQGIREGDFVGRYGGDEFIVLLPHTELAVGMEQAEVLRSKVAEHGARVTIRGEQASIAVSIGVAAPRQGDTPESLLSRADQALYKCKRRGRNQVCCEELPEEIGAPAQDHQDHQDDDVPTADTGAAVKAD